MKIYVWESQGTPVAKNVPDIRIGMEIDGQQVFE